MAKIWSDQETQNLVYYTHYLQLPCRAISRCFPEKNSIQIRSKTRHTKGYVHSEANLQLSDREKIQQELEDKGVVRDETIKKLGLKTLDEIGKEFQANFKSYDWNPDKEKELQQRVAQFGTKRINWDHISEAMCLPTKVLLYKWRILKPKNEVIVWTPSFKEKFLELVAQKVPLKGIAQKMNLEPGYCKIARDFLSSTTAKFDTEEQENSGIENLIKASKAVDAPEAFKEADENNPNQSHKEFLEQVLNQLQERS